MRVAGAGSGGRFWKVPESSGVCWCSFRRQVPEAGSGEFRCVLSAVQVPEEGSEGYGEFRCGLLPCILDRSSHVIVLNTFWWWHCPHGQNHCEKNGAHVVERGIRVHTAVGDTTKAYFFFSFSMICMGNPTSQNEKTIEFADFFPIKIPVVCTTAGYRCWCVEIHRSHLRNIFIKFLEVPVHPQFWGRCLRDRFGQENCVNLRDLMCSPQPLSRSVPPSWRSKVDIVGSILHSKLSRLSVAPLQCFFWPVFLLYHF